MKRNFEIISFPTAEELALAAASLWLDEIESAKRANRTHCVALSGGRVTQKFFATVVEQAKARKIAFERVDFFWADERCVPPTDPESNFKMANGLLFAPLKISKNQIHRIRGEDAPETAAEAAEKEIRHIVESSNGRARHSVPAAAAAETVERRARSDAPYPVLDLIFLGLGEDGHIASLFPGEPETWLADKAVYRAVKNSPKPPPNRVTLGYQTIAAARQVWMLASGTGKEAALRESLSPEGKTPFAGVLKLRCQTKIFTDVKI